LAEEAPHLMPLPAHAYDTAEVVYRCVSAEGLIAYGQNRYSVPWRHIGLTLPVRVTETEVIIYGPQIEEIARHALIPRHLTSQTVRLKIHQPSDDSEKKYEVLKRRYEELGEAAGRFFAEIVKRRRYGKAEAHKILSLLETYHRQDLLAAIERAVRYGAYSQRAIERILAVSATPKTALDRLAEKEQKQLDALLEDRSVQPRSGKEYQQMFDNPSDNQIDDSTDNQTDDSTDHEKQTDNQSPADEPTDFRDEESPGSAEDSESS
jgi:hypothetical protein